MDGLGTARGLGALIREYRLASSLSQAEMALRLGMSKAYLSQIESRNRGWPQKYIPSIARELGVSQADLAVAAGKIEASRIDLASAA